MAFVNMYFNYFHVIFLSICVNLAQCPGKQIIVVV